MLVSFKPNKKAALFCVIAFIQLITTILLIVGTTAPQFTHRHNNLNYNDIDMWLRQHDCDRNVDTNDDFGCTFKNICPARLHKFNAVAAFSIIEIILCFATFILCVVEIFVNTSLRIVIMALNALRIITILIIWALISGMYNNNDKRTKNTNAVDAVKRLCNNLHSLNYKYTTGWILELISWFIVIVSFVLLFIPVEKIM